MLEMLSLPPEACVFVDDRPKNIVAANDVGMYGLLFSGNEKLFADLQALGITLF
jgi:FMN phosphatase YigB (HAD superfamily)